MDKLTLTQAIAERDLCLTSSNGDKQVMGAVLTQLIGCLEREQTPKISQIVTIEETLIALKSDGTLHESVGGRGFNWKVLPLPK